jgi:predicted small metal-binding protein
MEKVIRCRDVGFDFLKMAAEHAKTVHGIREITPDVLAKVKQAMHDEPARR